MRLGLLGGTFDPVHLGHLELARQGLQIARLDAVYFVTSVKPPHKTERTHANFLDRHAMVALALRGDPRLIPSSVEFDREGKSYSVDTVLQLKQLAGGRAEIFFLIGLDAFMELPTWKEYRRFSELCSFIVFARPGYHLALLTENLPEDLRPKPVGTEKEIRAMAESGRGCFLVTGFSSPLSSTAIRDAVRTGHSIHDWVPRDVEEYILKTKLYLT